MCCALTTAASFGAQELALPARRIDPLDLHGAARGRTNIQRRMVRVAATSHFDDFCGMAPVKRPQLPLPTQRLGMAAIAALPLCDDGPDRVQLAVLTQKMRPAQPPRSDIPNAHFSCL